MPDKQQQDKEDQPRDIRKAATKKKMTTKTTKTTTAKLKASSGRNVVVVVLYLMILLTVHCTDILVVGCHIFLVVIMRQFRHRHCRRHDGGHGSYSCRKNAAEEEIFHVHERGANVPTNTAVEAVVWLPVIVYILLLGIPLD